MAAIDIEKEFKHYLEIFPMTSFGKGIFSGIVQR